MRHHSFMRWASATMAALMFFQCTAPVAFATDDKTAADGTVTDTIETYYVYSFEEDEVPGYTMTDSAYDEKTYHATITNTHHPRLPDTGSTGDWMFVIIGVGILLLALSVPRKRKGREEAQS